MLNYLDNSSSVGPHSPYVTGYNNFYGHGGAHPHAGLNENYAREVMELHTVGRERRLHPARCHRAGPGLHRLSHRKAPRRRGLRTGRVRGLQALPRGQDRDGLQDQEERPHQGIQALEMLADVPQCARFISTKLAVRFVSDTPPPAMIERMTQTWVGRKAHRRCRRSPTTVNSPEFFFHRRHLPRQLKTPLDFGGLRRTPPGAQATFSPTAWPRHISQLHGHSMATRPHEEIHEGRRPDSTTQLVSRMKPPPSTGSVSPACKRKSPRPLVLPATRMPRRPRSARWTSPGAGGRLAPRPHLPLCSKELAEVEWKAADQRTPPGRQHPQRRLFAPAAGDCSRKAHRSHLRRPLGSARHSRPHPRLPGAPAPGTPLRVLCVHRCLLFHAPIAKTSHTLRSLLPLPFL